MMAVNQMANISINRVYSTFAGGVLATSIIIMGNGAVTLGHNSDCLGQIVSHFNEKTNILDPKGFEPSASALRTRRSPN